MHSAHTQLALGSSARVRIDTHEAPSALDDAMPDEVQATRPAGGNGVWVELPKRVDVAALLRDAASRGLAAGFGPSFCVEGEPRPALVLSCAVATETELRAGVALLAELVEEALG